MDKYQTSNDNGYKSKTIIDRMFDPNFLKALPFLLLPTVIGTIISLILVIILPPDLLQSTNPPELEILLIPTILLGMMLLLRYLYKNGLYFRLSFYIVIIIMVVAELVAITNLIGGTAGFTIIITPTASIFVVMMVIYIIRSVQQPLDTMIEETDRVAKGTLTYEKKGLDTHGREFGEYEKSFTTMIENFSSIISQTQNASEQVAASAAELAPTSEELNALSEEIAATIQQISRGASQQSELVTRSIDDVIKMSEIVDQSLRDIEGTLQVIEDIAGQTNILALNAAIEAARAGEYGRGFAVVADNVRRLAEETKTNSSEISKVTENIVSNIGNSLTQLQESLQGFAAQSEEFSASSEEVAAATEEQTAATHQMTTTTQQLNEMSESLSRHVSKFRILKNPVPDIERK
jgi:methyl-accepting chemotaxis protein